MTLLGFGAVLADLTDALVNRRARLGARAFLDGLRRDVRQAFATGTDPVTGLPWPPRKGRRAGPGGGRLLVRSGLLMNSAIDAADTAVPSGWGVTVTLRQPPYAFVHQHGTRTVPRRRFFGVSPATTAAVRKNCVADIVSLMVSRN